MKNEDLFWPVKAATIIVIAVLGMKITAHPEKSEPHNHTEPEMPIKKWHVGSGEFNVSGSTSCNYQDFV